MSMKNKTKKQKDWLIGFQNAVMGTKNISDRGEKKKRKIMKIVYVAWNWNVDLNSRSSFKTDQEDPIVPKCIG
jgi:hypothetical protein